MRTRCRPRFAILLTGGLIAVGFTAFASGQEPEPAAKDPKPPLREQTIYVPYGKLRETFEKPGRGVFLPYEEFQRLWEAARTAQQPPPDDKSPVPVVITDVESEASVEKDVVRVKARLKIDLLRPGWHEVPLRLNDAAILAATVEGRPADIATDEQGGHKLIVRSTSQRPVEVKVELEYARAFTKAAGRNRVSFAAPQAAVNRWTVRIPQPGVEVEVRPLVAASAETPAPGVAATDTVLKAFVGSTPTIDIQWTPKSEGAAGLAAVVTTQVEQEVTLEPGAMRTRARLSFAISRAEMARLTLAVPDGHKVVNVFDSNVRKWSVAAAEKGEQKVTVDLFEPRRGEQSLVVDLERFTDEKAGEKSGQLTVPVIRAVDVGRQQGTVVVRIAPGLRTETTLLSGLSQVDAAELPPALARQPWHFSYRYAAVPFTLELKVEKVQPQIHVAELVEAYLEPDKLTLDHTAIFDVKQAGVFQFQTEIPQGFDVREVRGQSVAGAAAAAVESHHRAGPNNSRLVINLSSRAQGRVGIFTELTRRLDDPNLSGPTGAKSTLPLAIPRVAPDSAEDVRGWVVVYAPESLHVNAEKLTGTFTVSAAEAYAVVPTSRGGRFSGAQSRIALGYTKQPVSMSLVAERRRPQVEAAQLLVVRAKPGVVSYEATFHYNISYSGVKTLRIDLPAALAGQIHNDTTTGVREQLIDPKPKDVADQYVAWNLTGPAEFFGAATVKFTWEKKLDKLEVGKSVNLEVPRLSPRNVDRAWGQIVLAKEESIDVTPVGDAKGLRPIDPQQELMPQARVPSAASAFEFHDDWTLTVAAMRYQPEEIKLTSIEQGVVRMVCTRDDKISVQALYRMRSAGQRLKVALPANVQFDTDPVRINGRTATLEKGKTGEHYVPLAGQSADKAFVLELRYRIEPGTPRQLDLPAFPDEPAVQKVVLCVYVPQELGLLGSRGSWTAESPPTLFGFQSCPPEANRIHINELIKDANLAVHPADSFPTDGKLYVYSTLAPEAAPNGSLRLVTFSENWFHGLVFALAIAGGLVVLRRPVSNKIFVVAALLIGLILAGVFLPTLAAQLARGYLPLAVLVVFVLWAAWHLVQLLSRAQARLAPAMASAGPPTSPVAATPVAPDPAAPPSPRIETAAPPDTPSPPPPESPPTTPPDERGGPNNA